MMTIRKKTCRELLAFAACVILSVSPCRAQKVSEKEEAEEDSIFNYHELKGVTVTAERQHGIIPSQQLSGKELERLNGLNVADALRFFAGVQLKDYGGVGGIKTINIRSMGTNHVGVFYDGIQLSNAQNGQET